MALIWGHMSLVSCTYDWNNGRSSRMLILCIPQPVAWIYLTVASMTLTVKDPHQFKIEFREEVLLYGGVRSSSRVCAGICEGVSIVS
jgi:hypothetical protein